MRLNFPAQPKPIHKDTFHFTLLYFSFLFFSFIIIIKDLSENFVSINIVKYEIKLKFDLLLNKHIMNRSAET